MSTAATLYCSFCGKSEHEVAKLIAGPDCFICNECVDLCNDVIAEVTVYPRKMTAADLGLPDPEAEALAARQLDLAGTIAKEIVPDDFYIERHNGGLAKLDDVQRNMFRGIAANAAYTALRRATAL